MDIRMTHYKIFSLAPIIFAILASASMARDNSNLPYMNPKLSAEERAADLVHRMTLEEKASQLVNQARAVPRLNIPSYDWWSEALHGVIFDGVTEFPEPIGLAATFDVPRIHEMATAMVSWVEKGTTPASVVATGKAFPGRSRPLCAYPKHAQYKGQGNTEEAANFECR
jgi:beta-glucosidase-like glycosyl hydrolase